jgi:hypothetical protein
MGVAVVIQVIYEKIAKKPANKWATLSVGCSVVLIAIIIVTILNTGHK